MAENVELTFVTYNLDSQPYNFEERLDTFLKQIKKSPPDVVVVQEGTRLTYEKLLRNMGLMGYKRHLHDVMRYRSTGEMIFSKFPMVETHYLKFQRGNDQRGLLLSKLDVWGKSPIWVCTSQFDGKYPLQRSAIQEFPKLMGKILPEGTPVIFGGDTQILEYQKDLKQPDGWCDAWYEAGVNAEKYTLDHQTNFLVEPPFKDRPDQIWFYPTENLECVECKLYGHLSDTVISSHYGVWAKFILT